MYDGTVWNAVAVAAPQLYLGGQALGYIGLHLAGFLDFETLDMFTIPWIRLQTTYSMFNLVETPNWSRID